jgi:hypothetical protein
VTSVSPVVSVRTLLEPMMCRAEMRDEGCAATMREVFVLFRISRQVFLSFFLLSVHKNQDRDSIFFERKPAGFTRKRDSTAYIEQSQRLKN